MLSHWGNGLFLPQEVQKYLGITHSPRSSSLGCWCPAFWCDVRAEVWLPLEILKDQLLENQHWGDSRGAVRVQWSGVFCSLTAIIPRAGSPSQTSVGVAPLSSPSPWTNLLYEQQLGVLQRRSSHGDSGFMLFGIVFCLSGWTPRTQLGQDLSRKELSCPGVTLCLGQLWVLPLAKGREWVIALGLLSHVQTQKTALRKYFWAGPLGFCLLPCLWFSPKVFPQSWCSFGFVFLTASFSHQFCCSD